eukprot:CAMPEP_0177268548 /NCGR_PEP_ID=MMETSP0367-20130122/63871_1 /TAXON_ID=447022 ORGANISM="Scrippsiella hangoei-like, Strain SHHI-4" /NCGR_SAMPLE_ID=MMETSP0367 /ASSEMBLY_ACC=CAM_ASM_000362 /LENGTH=599 /DNA_ID=CAMNT_0018724181 /DNA_START=44 /DNA_END=1844 /DNA_ORIENTATION=+
MFGVGGGSAVECQELGHLLQTGQRELERSAGEVPVRFGCLLFRSRSPSIVPILLVAAILCSVPLAGVLSRQNRPLPASAGTLEGTGGGSSGLFDSRPAAQCAGSIASKCTEDGNPDAECCSMPGQGGCSDGFIYIAGEDCLSNGAKRTCCIRPRVAKEGQCAFLEEHKCQESGKLDADCCALAGAGSCETGYQYEVGGVCFRQYGALTTCCRKLSKADLEPAYPPTGECAKGAENCAKAQCCKEKGLQCYSKEGDSAFCRASCSQGDHSWSCNALGNRTRDDSTAAGSWPGDNCGWTTRCNLPDMSCFVKNEYFATCKASCSPGEVDTADSSQHWACQKLGLRAEAGFASAQPGQRILGLSLFCILVTSSRDDAALVEYQRNNTFGAFRCDGTHVVRLKSDSRKLPEGTDTSLSNAPASAFMDMWADLRDQGEYLKYDWVAKVHADTVWFPSRLKRHLMAMRVPAGTKVFVESSGAKLGFEASFEVATSSAFSEYLKHEDLCALHIDKSQAENVFLTSCLLALGIDYIKDITILDSRYNWDSGYEINDVAFCTNGLRPAFHPVKSPDLWETCHTTAQNAEWRPEAQAKIPDQLLNKLRK